MSLAEKIIRVLDALANQFDDDNENHVFKPYIEFSKERYRYWRIRTDFKSAARKARTETAQKVIDEFK